MLETSDLYPGVALYPPMLVHKCPDGVEKLLSKDKWVASKKVDGYWETLVKENDQVYMFARSKSKQTGFYTMKIDNMPHLREWAMEELPNGTVLIGEAYVPGGTSKDVTKILGCLPEKAVERQKGEYGNLHYYIHDMIKFNGEDHVAAETPYIYRYDSLHSFIDSSNLIPEIEIAEIYSNSQLDLLSWGGKLMEEGEEGIVVRNENGLYLPGKRRKEMFKIKQETTIDAVILDCLEPEKVYTGKELETWPYWEGDVPVTKPYALGWNNAFRVGAYDSDGRMVTIGTVASGLTDEHREAMGNIPEKYIGLVIEVQAMSVDKDELSLRHPRFIRFRPDKSALDCTIESIFY